MWVVAVELGSIPCAIHSYTERPPYSSPLGSSFLTTIAYRLRVQRNQQAAYVVEPLDPTNTPSAPVSHWPFRMPDKMDIAKQVNFEMKAQNTSEEDVQKHDGPEEHAQNTSEEDISEKALLGNQRRKGFEEDIPKHSDEEQQTQRLAEDGTQPEIADSSVVNAPITGWRLNVVLFA